MTKQYSGLLKVTIVLLAVVIMIINLYALVKDVDLFAGAPTVNDILFIVVFTLIGIERVLAKDKYEHLYLALRVVMGIIIILKYATIILLCCTRTRITNRKNQNKYYRDFG